jgi:hypothetical protein
MIFTVHVLHVHAIAVKFVATSKYKGVTHLALGTELRISIHKENKGMYSGSCDN